MVCELDTDRDSDRTCRPRRWTVASCRSRAADRAGLVAIGTTKKKTMSLLPPVVTDVNASAVVVAAEAKAENACHDNATMAATTAFRPGHGTARRSPAR